jgi:hypothetical protein
LAIPNPEQRTPRMKISYKNQPKILIKSLGLPTRR